MRIIIDVEYGCMVRGKSFELPLRDFVRTKRIERGLTISGLTALAGLNHPAYSMWENGQTKSPINGLIAMQALGYDIFILGDGQ